MKPQLHRRKPTSISNRDRFAQETERNDSASQRPLELHFSSAAAQPRNTRRRRSKTDESAIYRSSDLSNCRSFSGRNGCSYVANSGQFNIIIIIAIISDLARIDRCFWRLQGFGYSELERTLSLSQVTLFQLFALRQRCNDDGGELCSIY